MVVTCPTYAERAETDTDTDKHDPAAPRRAVVEIRRWIV
jgi:hypothetical protein